MQTYNKKIIRWTLGGGLFTIFLLIPEMFIADWLSKNTPESFRSYFVIMMSITAFIYLVISVIKLVKYQKYAKKYEREEVEKASKELTSEFRQVILNYPELIPENLFKCQAKIDYDGKIVCKIQLDYEVKIENYEKFLRLFHFTQN